MTSPPLTDTFSHSTIAEFYRQHSSKGKVGELLVPYENLSPESKRDIFEQFKVTHRQFLKKYETFLRSLSKEEFAQYIQQNQKDQQEVS